MFCKLELHVLRQEKTLLKIWLNPGLNLTIFRGTGASPRKKGEGDWHTTIVCGIVTRDSAPVFPVPSNSPRSLCQS